MAVLAFASAKGAPGVTTSVLALAFAWHRPALIVEADMTGSSSVLSGFLRGGPAPLRLEGEGVLILA